MTPSEKGNVMRTHCPFSVRRPISGSHVAAQSEYDGKCRCAQNRNANTLKTPVARNGGSAVSLVHVVLIGHESSRARESFRWRAGVGEYDGKCRRCAQNHSAELASTPVARNVGCAPSGNQASCATPQAATKPPARRPESTHRPPEPPARHPWRRVRNCELAPEPDVPLFRATSRKA